MFQPVWAVAWDLGVGGLKSSIGHRLSTSVMVGAFLCTKHVTAAIADSYSLFVLYCSFQVNSMKELYLLIEEEELNPQQQGDNKTCAGDSWSQNTVRWDEWKERDLHVCKLFLWRFLCNLFLGMVLLYGPISE